MTQKILRLGVIGLGAMGAEMLDVAVRDPGIEVVLAADPNTRALDGVRAAHPEVALTADPEEVLAREDIDAVYIASPPATHAGYTITAMKAGKSVFCEKPLAVDLSEAAEMVAVAEATGAVNALNYTFSDRAAAVEVARAVRAGEAGSILGVEIRLLFPQWPRAFQRDAGWVAGREQGGFLREVGSHYAFLTDRIVGPLERIHTLVEYGEQSESSATGLFSANGVPVHLNAHVAAGPETYEWTLYGSRRSYRITDWADLWIGDSEGWHRSELPLPRGGEDTRLAEFAGAVGGKPSTLADFAAGLRVQQVIESFHDPE
ncbi:Gfo/Idh/MocA family oxidoreductase [Nocardia sp. NPDC051030]|uniref:Gfo/Idh/MocA family protein n=1 Tax=Nocardia sp. NPDC051030 TaxID=3155162 RepID=UPI003427899F